MKKVYLLYRKDQHFTIEKRRLCISTEWKPYDSMKANTHLHEFVIVRRVHLTSVQLPAGKHCISAGVLNSAFRFKLILSIFLVQYVLFCDMDGRIIGKEIQ